jgi:hypothetical protein
VLSVYNTITAEAGVFENLLLKKICHRTKEYISEGWGNVRKIFLAKLRMIKSRQPIPVAARCKAWDCGRSLVGTVDSNPAEGTDVSLL